MIEMTFVLTRVIKFQSGVYCMSTGQPLIRLPLFIMGIAAGLHVLRYHNKKSYKDENLYKNLFFIIFPWSLNLNKDVSNYRVDKDRKS